MEGALRTLPTLTEEQQQLASGPGHLHGPAEWILQSLAM